LFEKLKETIARYIHLRLEEFRLGMIERLGNILGYLASVLITFFLSSLALFFIGLGVAFWLSALFGNKLLGFFATAGIFILVIILFLVFRRSFMRSVVGILAREITRPKKKKRDNDIAQRDEVF
jgi:hypothetical protein